MSRPSLRHLVIGLLSVAASGLAAADPSAEARKQVLRPEAVLVSNGRLEVNRTVLIPEIAARIEQALDAHPEIREVVFTDVPGGLLSAELGLTPRFRNVDVFVKGYCHSACTHLALSAKTVTLLEDRKRAPTLFVHSTFSIATGQSVSLGPASFQFYADRLPGLPHYILARTLGGESPMDHGILFTTRAPEQSKPSASQVFWCTPLPAECAPVLGVTLEGLRIRHQLVE